MIYHRKIRHTKEITMNTRTDEQRAQNAQIKLCDKVTYCELSNDYTLPDYQPEIRRVLRVSASVLPASKYVSGSRAELGGTVDYHLLYVASDGKLYSAPLASEYELSAPLDIDPRVDLGEGITLLANVTADNETARVSAPRKINIKCRVNADVRAYGTITLDELISGEAETNSIQRLSRECRSDYVSAGVSETRDILAEFDTVSDGMRVIDSNAELLITDAYIDSRGAKCKGELRIELFVCNENTDGEPTCLRKSIPFEDSVELDGELEYCVARGYVSDIKVNVEDGKIICEASVFCEVTAHAGKTVIYTKDIYSTERFCETAQKQQTLFTPLYCAVSNFSQSERMELSEGQTAIGATTVGCYCSALSDDCIFSDGKYIVSGNCKYTVIARKDGEYFCFDQTLPFKYEFASGNEHSCAHVRVHPSSAMARIDGNLLCLDAELYVCAELSKEFSISTLSEARFGEELNKKCGDMIVCYPTPDDTLWSVSKKYRIPSISLDGISDPEAKLDGVDYLIVNF